MSIMSAVRRVQAIIATTGIAVATLVFEWIPPPGTLQQFVNAAEQAPAEAKKAETRVDYAFPVDSKRAPKIIASVLHYVTKEVSAEEWKNVIDNLQSLLDEPDGKFVEWTDPLTKKSNKQSIRKVVNILIGRFSKEGRDFYERQTGPAASRLLKEALDRGDPTLLSNVSQRYFHTKAGGEATILLACRHLDRGDYLAADMEFNRFMERNLQEPPPMNVSFLAALTCKRLANVAASRGAVKENEHFQKRADEHWAKVKKEAGGKKITLGNSKEVTLAQLEAEYARLIAVKQNMGQAEWALSRGNPQNNAQGVGSRPLLDPSWQFSLTPILDTFDQETKSNGMAWIENNLMRYREMTEQRPDSPLLPAFFPIAASGRIIFRTYDGVCCVATSDEPAQTPPVKAFDLIWACASDNSLYEMAKTSISLGDPSNSAKSAQIDQLNSYYMLYGPHGILFENGLNGALSHDGVNVYFVDDMALPPHPQQQLQNGYSGLSGAKAFGPVFGPMVGSNKLVAVNLQTGKRVWKADGRNDGEKKDNAPTDQNPFADAYFLGAPLPLKGKLYVVIEKDREIRLLCLNPAKVVDGRPELEWSQPLGMPVVPLPADSLRRIQGISLAYGHNLMIVPTNAGAVLGIDALSHEIVWARTYRPTRSREAPQTNLLFRPAQTSPNPETSADHWRMGAPIIVDDKVVFTAWDAESVMCLNLRDGEVIWESNREAGDMFVAAVIDNKVLVAGQHGMKFLDLHSGSKLATVPIATPSGAGTASNGIYFLPVRPSREIPEPEVLSISVKEMKVVGHARSRMKVPAGNLLFFDGAVFSQTALSLTAFPQLDLQVKDADRRLAANANDPIGLAERGQLLLDDSKRAEAITAFNKCLANNPDFATRAKVRKKLHDTITAMLLSDFSANEKFLEQYRELCTVEILESDDALKRQIKNEEQLRREANYASLVAAGRESQGRLVEAFNGYLEFSSLFGNKQLVSSIDQPNTFARADVWAFGRINNMLNRAAPDQRKPLEALAAKEWEMAKASGDLEKLRNFVRRFGTAFAAGVEARLMLAEKLVTGNDADALREAENTLLELKGLEDAAFAARATEALARLYVHKELFEDAIGLYTDLNRIYPNVVVRDGHAGADIFKRVVAEKRNIPYLESPKPQWADNHIKAGDVNVSPDQAPQPNNQQRQSFTISPDDDSIPFFSRYKIVFDVADRPSQSWKFKIIDRTTGLERFTSTAMPAPSYVWNYRVMNNHRFAQIRGHLLVINFNNMVYAYDLADQKKLWEYNLFGKTPMQLEPRAQNEPDGVRLCYQDGWTQKVGQVAVIASSYVCLSTRAGLVALDPAKGTVLWTNSNIGPCVRLRLMGDDNHIFVYEANDAGSLISARAFRASDGVELRVPDSTKLFAELKKSAPAGRYVLMLLDKGDKKSVRLYDILTGRDDWKKEIESDAVILQCEDPNFTGYVSSNGDINVFRVKDGKNVFSGTVDEKKRAEHMDKVDSAVLLIDRERFFFMLNRPIESNDNYYNPALTPVIRGLRVNGCMYCFDRNTQKRLWFTDEQLENQQIILDQFRDLPVVLGANVYNGVIDRNEVSVMAIDKRTGCCLYRNKLTANAHFNALNADPRTGVVELIRADMRIKFTVDENKPRVFK